MGFCPTKTPVAHEYGYAAEKLTSSLGFGGGDIQVKFDSKNRGVGHSCCCFYCQG